MSSCATSCVLSGNPIDVLHLYEVLRRCKVSCARMYKVPVCGPPGSPRKSFEVRLGTAFIFLMCQRVVD